MSSRKLEYERRKRVEQRRKRRHAALKGWETIRRKERESTKYREELQVKRRAAAKKGVYTRRIRAAEAKGDVITAAELRGELRGENRYKQELLEGGWNGLHGSNPEHRAILQAMIDHHDKQWEIFLKTALELGYSARQARNMWFSPKVRQVA